MERDPWRDLAHGLTLVLRPAAASDIEAARNYYEDARPGLRVALAEDLDRLFARLEAFPRSAPVVEGYPDVRGAPLRRFPNAVSYRISDDDRIDVLRVIHRARSPEGWPR